LRKNPFKTKKTIVKLQWFFCWCRAKRT